MPLIVLSGHPSSGKSVVAERLAALWDQAGLPAQHIDEGALLLTRADAYQNAVHEKNTRGALKSAAERIVSKDKVVILDSLNNIKGFRYELWCVARGAATRYALVHVDTPADTCRQWNQQRPEGTRWPEHILEDLLGRFEIPDTRNKWDCPLYTVKPLGPQEEWEAVLQEVVQALTRPAGAATRPGAGDLRPTLATTNPTLSGTNLLHDIDQAAQDVIDRIMSAQTASGSGAAGVVDLGVEAGTLSLQRPVSLAELRRHKRAFLKLATKLMLVRLQDAKAARRLFAEHLMRSFAEGGDAG